VPDLIIDDSTGSDRLFNVYVNGELKGRGHDPSQVRRAMFDSPSGLQLIPRSEWSARIKQKSALKAQISDRLRRDGIPSLDQGPVGYCWAHSTTGAVQAQRALAGQPYVPLSAYAIAATIKHGADEGGWCGLSAQFAREKGIPAQSLWPQGDRNYRKYDKPEVWENAALHKTTEEWVDLTSPVYDQQLTFDQVATCLLVNIPCALDFNWWSHSVMGCDLVEVEPGDFGIRIRNSWGDQYGDQGFAVLRGSRCRPDSALAIRVSVAS
jgi:C1A family cysteine protease